MHTWLRKLGRILKGQPQRRQPIRSRRLSLEGLEDRCLMAGSLTGTQLTLSLVEAQQYSGPVASFRDSDGDNANHFSVTIDWGDQSTSTGTVADDGSGGFNVNGSHTYLANDQYTIQVLINDDDGSSLTISSTGNVADAPIHASGVAVNATEGVTFTTAVATFTQDDPNATAGNFTATIDWGDGTPASAGSIAPSLGGGFHVDGTHAYVHQGSYPITVQIASQGGSTATANSTAAVADAALTATGLSIQATEGKSFSGPVATVTDANALSTAGDFTATIDWGDGNSSAGTVQAHSGGGYEVVGTHTYHKPGTSPISISVQDIDGSSASASGQATVQDAPLVGVGVPVNVPRNLQANNVLVATFTDTGGPEPVANYSATINWGDNRPASQGTITVNGDTFSVLGSHTFATPGRFPLSITIRSGGGASVTVASNAFVASMNDRFVAKAYLDILGRPVDPNGLTHWTRLLDSGAMTRTQVAHSLATSQEFRIKVVRELYRTLLGRDADSFGLNTFVNFLASGGTIADVKGLLIGSLEYSIKNGNSIDGFLTAVYRDVLGRPVDPVGRAAFTLLLSTGTSRTVVALLIVKSRESYTRLVAGYYSQFLGRQPDDGGLNLFVNALVGGTREEAVIAALVGSEEYYNRL